LLLGAIFVGFAPGILHITISVDRAIVVFGALEAGLLACGKGPACSIDSAITGAFIIFRAAVGSVTDPIRITVASAWAVIICHTQIGRGA
tara:strand:+ start:293 stop:562 length:270 start_codon:yes stop_codon:yes gene_type:complete